MSTNIDRCLGDIERLIKRGELLLLAMQAESSPSEFKEACGTKADEIMAKLPRFVEEYQPWYSEAEAVVRQLLPNRLADFVRFYGKPKGRKEITWENYRIEDYLQHLTVTRGYDRVKLVGPEAAIPHFQQQLSIVKTAKGRLKSSLFDIRQLVQADLFESQLEAAKALANNGYLRASGALAGVVLEEHLAQVCADHGLKLKKAAPTIADYNEALKAADVADTATWRFVQYLADIRNLCDHKKADDPTQEQISDLIGGVSKILKTLI
ncbi:MAG: hypothetical protein WD024_08615 [Bacillota bacterium]